MQRKITGRTVQIDRVTSPCPRILALLTLTLWVGCAELPEASEPCAGPEGTICTWIGDGEAGYDGDHHALLASSLYWPVEITLRDDGRTWVLDWNNHRVREVVDGKLVTVIGNQLGDGPDDLADKTEPGANGTTVNLNHPTQLVPQADGSLMLVAWHNHKLRRFNPDTGKVVIACGGGAGFKGDGGPAHDAQLNQPQSIAPDGAGGYMLLDQRNQVVRQIDKNGIIQTVAGTPKTAGFAGDGGDPLQAKFAFPAGSNPPPGGWITVGADGVVYVSDTLNHRIRRIDFQAHTIDTIAGTGVAGFGGDGGAAKAAQLNNPRKIVFGPDGRLYVADELNHRIRVIDMKTGVISTVAGNGTGAFSGDGGPATSASLFRPAAVAFSPVGEMIIVDTYNHRIRRVSGSVGGK